MSWSPTNNALTDLQISDFARVSDFYAHQNPRELRTYEKRLDYLRPRFSRAHRETLVAALREYNERIGAPRSSQETLNRLLEPNSVVVVSGQQAGLFTGPLYTVAKALSAYGYAKELERDLGVPVIPMFWVASEDHDFDEVNHAFVLGDDDSVERVSLHFRAEPHQMVYHSSLSEEDVRATLRELYDKISDGPYKSEMMGVLRETYQTGDSLSMWFAKTLRRLLGDVPIVFVDPCIPELRELVHGGFASAIENVAEVQARLENAYRAVEEAGFRPEVIRDASNSTVFYIRDGRRYVLEWDGENTLQVRGEGDGRSLKEWAELARTHPDSFSSNVLFRPVIQDYLLPTLAYVGGPSEIAYHALSKAVFEAHNREMPPLLMRQRMTVVPPHIVRNSQKWNIDLASMNQFVDLVGPYVQKSGAEEMAKDLTMIQEQTNEMWTQFTNRFDEYGPQVHDVVDRQVARTEHSLRKLERKLKNIVEDRHRGEVGQLRSIERWMWMDGHPQERRMCPMNLWTLLGLEWFHDLPAYGNYQEPGSVLHIQCN